MANEFLRMAAELKAAEPTSEPGGEWVSAATLAKMLDCSVRTVWRLKDSGGLPAPVFLGRLVRWRKSSVLMFLEEAAAMGGRR